MKITEIKIGQIVSLNKKELIAGNEKHLVTFKNLQTLMNYHEHLTLVCDENESIEYIQQAINKL